MKKIQAPAVIWLLGAVLASCAGKRPVPLSADIDEAAFRQHVQVLASDEFEGRKPATHGEEMTVGYLLAQFKKLGLKPGNGDSFIQEVPLVEITADKDASLVFDGRGKSSALKYGTDMVIWTKHPQPLVELRKSEMVFAGYGIVAPEYQWDDYAGIDARGKTVVVLVNDPGHVTKDPPLFKGRTMTYYGRWTYKLEEAARHGASGVLIIHDTSAAAYGWNVVQSGWTGPQLDKSTAEDNAGRALIEGWISAQAARALFAQAGLRFDEAAAAAARHGFKSVPMGLTASAVLHNDIRRSKSANVIAVLPGGKRKQEYVFYTAHWDHLGKKADVEGRTQIYHGAVDNATGVAGILTLAQSFSRAQTRPGRSIVFMAVTGEESGLLGSAYYADNPIYPLKNTVAVINIDAMLVGGPTRDVTVVGFGNSELEDYLRDEVALQGRELRPDPEPEMGHFFRSDHFSFAKHGVPALYAGAGIDDAARGPKYGQAQVDDYYEHRYHQPSDVYSADWDLRAAIDDMKLFYALGERLAQTRKFPNWYSNSEFRQIREKSRPEAE